MCLLNQPELPLVVVNALSAHKLVHRIQIAILKAPDRLCVCKGLCFCQLSLFIAEALVVLPSVVLPSVVLPSVVLPSVVFQKHDHSRWS